MEFVALRDASSLVRCRAIRVFVAHNLFLQFISAPLVNAIVSCACTFFYVFVLSSSSLFVTRWLSDVKLKSGQIFMSSFEYAFVPFSSEHNLHTGCFKTREKFKIAISELNDHRIFKQNGLFCHKCLAFLCF